MGFEEAHRAWQQDRFKVDVSLLKSVAHEQEPDPQNHAFWAGSRRAFRLNPGIQLNSSFNPIMLRVCLCCGSLVPFISFRYVKLLVCTFTGV